MSCSSFVINYLKFYSLCDCTFYYTHFPAVAFVHKTYTRDSFSNGCSVLNLVYASANISVDSRTSRSIAWAFAHLSTLVKLRTYDWLSLKPLGNNRLPVREDLKISLEGLRWVEGLYGGLILLAPLSSLAFNPCPNLPEHTVITSPYWSISIFSTLLSIWSECSFHFLLSHYSLPVC